MMMDSMNISKKQMLMYAGAIATLVVSASLIFSAIAGPKLQYATLIVDRYDVNVDSSNKRCPLSQDEVKRLGFVTLTIDDLSKVPKLEQVIERVDKGYEELINSWSKVWSKDPDGCYTLTDLPVFGYYPTSAGASITLTEDEYHTIKSLIYNAYRTQHTQEELTRLAELYKGFHPSDPSVNAMPTDLLESQAMEKDYADMSSAYIGFLDSFVKVDGKYYWISLRTISR
ncbi:MAG: hypothetical protein RMJ59_00090 [Candidatus Nitrosocaldus sp.]|nr:hypothetical protein [Candidatus Nitrosocaldus sp.]MDW8274767.1 hypothetical protein [Candidatus Nitrosocaldus sp.]